jgi:hypothetical protein
LSLAFANSFFFSLFCTTGLRYPFFLVHNKQLKPFTLHLTKKSTDLGHVSQEAFKVMHREIPLKRLQMDENKEIRLTVVVLRGI